MEAKEILELVNKQWATAQDIKKLASCGINQARRILKDISNELTSKNWYLPANKVPMSEVIEYLHINISYLKKVRD